MDTEKRKSYNALRDWRLPNVVRDIKLTGKAKDVAFSNGLGDGIEFRRQSAKARRAKVKAQKAARRRNR